MNGPAAKLMVMVGERFACVKIIGRANFTSSIDFKTLINELRQKDYSYFVLDLSECALMDSTFLGMLAGFGLKLNAAGESPDSIELLNPNPRITELLENLGVIHLFKLTTGEHPLPQNLQSQDQPCGCGTPSHEEVTRACLEAHHTLMEVNPENVSRFKEVTRFLAEDLKKTKV